MVPNGLNNDRELLSISCEAGKKSLICMPKQLHSSNRVIASGIIWLFSYNEYLKKTRLFESRTGLIYENTSNNDKVPVPLTDIGHIFSGIQMEDRKNVNLIIFPKLNFAMGSSFKIHGMDHRKKYTSLDSTCFTPFDSESLRLEWIRKRKKSIDLIVENKYDIIQSTIKSTEMLQLEYGPNSNKAEIIDEITR